MSSTLRRILLVKITDEDLKRDKGTISDRRINQLLKKIESYQPRIVGLYLFQSENNYLAANLQNQDNIFSTCLFNTLGKDEIPPPPNFPIDNVGFSNVVADNENDQIIRRSFTRFKTHPEAIAILNESLKSPIPLSASLLPVRLIYFYK